MPIHYFHETQKNDVETNQLRYTGEVCPYPSIGSFLCPNFTTKSFIFVLTVIQFTFFIAELVLNFYFTGYIFDANVLEAGPNGNTLKVMGAVYKEGIRNGEYWRFLTPMLLHASIIHITDNMWFQCMLCYTFEKDWGINRIIFYYIAGGVTAALGSSAFSSSASVGASGSLCALLGVGVSYIIFNWNSPSLSKGNSQNDLMRYVGCFFYIIMSGYAKTSMGLASVDNSAHILGFVGGILLGFIFTPISETKPMDCVEKYSLQFGAGCLFMVQVISCISLIYWF